MVQNALLPCVEDDTKSTILYTYLGTKFTNKNKHCTLIIKRPTYQCRNAKYSPFYWHTMLDKFVKRSPGQIWHDAKKPQLCISSHILSLSVNWHFCPRNFTHIWSDWCFNWITETCVRWLTYHCSEWVLFMLVTLQLNTLTWGYTNCILSF